MKKGKLKLKEALNFYELRMFQPIVLDIDRIQILVLILIDWRERKKERIEQKRTKLKKGTKTFSGTAIKQKGKRRNINKRHKHKKLF